MSKDILDTSLNTSIKNMFCNHCMFDCINYDKMKEHYKSEFHKYNLNRVTMNLNPLTHSEYLKKKEMYLQKMNTVAKVETHEPTSLICDICIKSFASSNKFKEHMISKSHKRAEEEQKTQPIRPKVEKTEEVTTIMNLNICLFCNKNCESLENNFFHMVEAHKLDVPFLFCIKNYKGLLKLLAKKIFTYNACLSCDSQNFKNFKSLQSHMMDKQHTFVNNDDLEEFLYKFYDRSKVFGLKEREFRMTKEFKILKFKFLLMKKKADRLKTETKEDEWESADEEEEKEKEKDQMPPLDDNEDYETIKLPNGELLLEDGTVLGNKIYKVFYKQRVHVNKFEQLIRSIKKQRRETIVIKSKKPKLQKMKYFSVVGSNKSNFTRINTLFKARAQVDV